MTSPLDRLHFGARKRLPVILQTEAAECGLACLAMIASYHGHETDLVGLRRRLNFSLKGARLTDIIQMAGKLGMSCRPIRLELDELDRLKTPALLHWELSHFVVLKKVTAKWVHIHNPALGARRYRREEVGKHFTGVAAEFSPTPGFEHRDDRQRLGLRSLWSNSIGLGRSILYGVVFTLIMQAFVLASPFYVQLAIDEAVLKQDADLLLVLAVGFGGIVLINAVARTFREYVVLHMGNMLGFQMSANLFRHLIRLPLSYFERRHIGDVVSRFSSTEPIRKAFAEGVVGGIADGLLAVTTLVAMCIYDWTLAGVVLLAVLLYAALRLALFSPLKTRSEEEIVEGAKQSSNFMETVRGIQSVKIFSREAERQSVWENKFAQHINAGIRVQKLGILFQTSNVLLSGIENVVVVYLGARLILNADFTIGMLYAFMSYKGQFSEKARALIEGGIRFYMLRLHLDRIADIALAEKEETVDTLPAYVRPLNGGLELRGCAYRYATEEPYIFENLNFSVAPGEYVALVGPSGCGKTTLLKLMIGLFNPTDGKLLIDGEPLSSFGLANYRSSASAVMQDDHLMSGSIAQNISFFDAEPDFARIEECAHLAGIHDEIIATPMRYDSLVGDMGTTLSGGQKQRVLIARALYRRPKILFLDEGTAHLDPASETRVSQMLRDLDITRIVVAHRPAMIEAADRVMHLGGGGLSALRSVEHTGQVAGN